MNSPIEIISHFIQTSGFAAWFLDALLKSFVVLIVAGGLCLCWRRASAATRHWIWFLAVTSIPFLPLLTSMLPSWQRPLWSVSTGFNSGNQISLVLELAPGTFVPRAPASPNAAEAAVASHDSTGGSRTIATSFSTNWMVLGLAAWFTGAVLVLLSTAIGHFRLHRFSRNAQPLLDADWARLLEEACEILRLRRPVLLLQSADDLMPLTWTWLRPVVLLPAEAGQWPVARRRVVLLHELAHVKRWDYLTQLAVRIVCAIFWCNPLVWLAARRLRVEQERACDDLVLNGGCKASDYAGHLVAIARSFRRVPQMAGIAMAQPSGLEQRVVAILDGQRNRKRMDRMVMILIVLVLFGLELLVGGYAKESSLGPWSLKSSEATAQLKAFVAEKEAQANAATNEPAPGFAPFFAAAERGDWLTISNAFEDFRNHAGQYEHTGKTDERLRGPKWQAIIEIWGTFYFFGVGDEKYSTAYANDIIHSIPPGSIYFGGTDPGRFLITGMEKSQVNADPFFLLTQNALADNTYLEYVRSMYGGKIYVPTTEDSAKCFEAYTQDAQKRMEANQLKPGEDLKRDANGKIQIRGQVAVMEINGLIAKIIFDQNTNREFYVEESFPLDWMYPYLEPHGLIFKINRQPLSGLSDELVQRDHDYWAKLIAPMIGDWLHDDTPVAEVAAFAKKVYVKKDLNGFTGDSHFIQNAVAQKMFSKERSSIAGLYAWRVNHPADASDKERMTRATDYAFRQAWALCPYSTEVVFRYVDFLLVQKRIPDAVLIGETAAQMPSMQGKDGEQIRNLVEQLQKFQKPK